jgi:MoaA/NifB/PqqE/SkfB family radical SAM enzyme
MLILHPCRYFPAWQLLVAIVFSRMIINEINHEKKRDLNKRKYPTVNTPDSRPTAEDELYSANVRLNRAELDMRRLHLTSMPLYLSVVLGTACNIDCAYCYQTRTSENLLTSDPFGIALRRELSAFYPYLSTLRIGGGEVFVISGFEELVDEISAAVNRPIISISTNGTLINDKWAEIIAGIPFQEVTVSIDGAIPDTYARLRKGASLHNVLGNVDRIQRIKARNKFVWPDVNFFFLIMRSNYREIPAFL